MGRVSPAHFLLDDFKGWIPCHRRFVAVCNLPWCSFRSGHPVRPLAGARCASTHLASSPGSPCTGWPHPLIKSWIPCHRPSMACTGWPHP